MSDRPLEGRHALVTGAGSGIGRSIAEHLAQQGASLTLVGRDQTKLDLVAASLPVALAAPADITDEQAVERAFLAGVSRFGPVSILVNNAGAAPSRPLVKTVRSEWEDTLAVNLTGAFLCIRTVLPGMVDGGWGRIVNVSSTAGLKGYPYVAAYCAAKHGLIGLTRALALEVARAGVTVNAVCPGFADTDIVARALDTITRTSGRSREDALSRLQATNPQNRLIQPREVASLVLWLCGPEAAAVNGAAFPISGGEI